MRYRAEIDGLRALAVIPVILFHAGFELFSGGFIGVDVFFVISGYLITTNLIDDMENNSFSLAIFYERRARRILPALFFVMLVCIPFGWLWMLPDPLENFGQSYVATTLFSNNILLYVTSDYWDLASEFKPMLHTWSLGIEEQYYVIFPVLLSLFWRFGKSKVFWIILALSLASLMLSEWSSRNLPTANFYLLHTRAWELLAGSIAAFVVQEKGVSKSDPMSLIGLAAIVSSIFYYDESTPFPSFYALIPVVGVFLIILYGSRETLAARFLGNKFFVGIGLISYSAYLWHQPIFAFSRVFSKTELHELDLSLLMIPVFLCAYFTWRFVEKPFRNREAMSLKTLSIVLFVTFSILVSFGYIVHKNNGFVSRVYQDSVSIGDINSSYNSRNFAFKADSFLNNDKMNVLVVGNSFGRDLVNVLRETYVIDAFNIVYRDDFSSCSVLANSNERELLNASNIVIFASGYDVLETECNDDLISFVEGQENHIFFVGTKQFGFNHNWIMRKNFNDRVLLRNPVLYETMQADRAASDALPSKNYISIMSPLTNEDGVLITDELGRLISPDRTHLTKFGAIFIGREIFLQSEFNDVWEGGDIPVNR